MKAKLLTFFLLLLFGFQFIGYQVYFHFEKKAIQKSIKKAIKEGVPEEQLIKFKFSEKEFRKLNFVKKREFKIGNRFYDIVWHKNINDLHILQCVDDVQESRLFINLAKLTHKKIVDGENTNLADLTLNQFQPYLRITALNVIDIRSEKHIHIKTQFFYNKKYQSRKKEILVPPPNNLI